MYTSPQYQQGSQLTNIELVYLIRRIQTKCKCRGWSAVVRPHCLPVGHLEWSQIRHQGRCCPQQCKPKRPKWSSSNFKPNQGTKGSSWSEVKQFERPWGALCGQVFARNISSDTRNLELSLANEAVLKTIGGLLRYSEGMRGDIRRDIDVTNMSHHSRIYQG